ncbi:MAG: response regulator transcription factor, partial [Pseudomonadota bacterium]
CLENYDSIDIVGAAPDAEKAFSLLQDVAVDVVLMDVNLPGLNGLDALGRILEVRPDLAVVILSMHDKREYVDTALSRGARGYILKDAPTNEIVAAIEAVVAGGVYFSSSVSALLRDGPIGRGGSALTAREEGVLLLLSQGLSNKEVARRLDISVRTVETHRKNIKRKTGIASTAGLTRYAIETGLAG